MKKIIATVFGGLSILAGVSLAIRILMGTADDSAIVGLGLWMVIFAAAWFFIKPGTSPESENP